jgi:nitrogen fixation NifU-like protein
VAKLMGIYDMKDNDLISSEFEEIDKLYQDVILNHYKNPRNSHPLSNPDIETHEVNPFCGDEIHVQLKFYDRHILRVGVQSVGCAITKASGSIMGESLPGKTIEQVELLLKQFRNVMNEGLSAVNIDRMELKPLEALIAVRKYPIRVKCVLLAWLALEEALKFRDNMPN